MKWHTANAICTVAALALATVLAGQAHADCSGSQRISHEEAECLEASWDNNVDALSNGKVTAKNTCADYGAVAVKIELASCTAIHATLSTGSEYWINTQTCDVEEESFAAKTGVISAIYWTSSPTIRAWTNSRRVKRPRHASIGQSQPQFFQPFQSTSPVTMPSPVATSQQTVSNPQRIISGQP